MATKKPWLSPTWFLFARNIEEQTFQKHSRKYRAIEAKNNDENMMYYKGELKKSSKIYFDTLESVKFTWARISYVYFNFPFDFKYEFWIDFIHFLG